MSEYLLLIVGLAVGIVGGYFLGKTLLQKSVKNQEEEAERAAERIVKEAHVTAENIKRDRKLEAKEHFLKLKSEFEDDANKKKAIIIQNEQKVKQMQQQAAQLLEKTKREENELNSLRDKLNGQMEAATKRKEEADKLLQQQVEQLEKLAGLSAEQAKEQLVDALRAEA